MDKIYVELRVDGKTVQVPALHIRGRTVVASGKWTKIAGVKDEDLITGEVVDDPEFFLSELKKQKFKADIFCFSQKLSQAEPKYSYCMEWDNAAVIPLKEYSDWWDKRLSQDTRRNIRRASKMGVEIRVIPFSDELVKGIVDIYDEVPIRQGKPFWHYQKGFDVVKKEAGTYLDRSEFIGAFFENQLIGFIKLSYGDESAHIIHILSKEQHADKRPTNALIAKAVEVSGQRKLSFLTYCRYIDGGNDKSPLTEFKRRNGFEPLKYPRYYIPLTLKGRIALKLNFHHGLRKALPKSLIPFLLGVRAKFFSIRYGKPGRSERSVPSETTGTA